MIAPGELQYRAFLLTDVVGSTRLWLTAPQAMDTALARHDQIMRNSVEAFGGAVFTTAGDSFAVAFVNARDAVEAATAAQEALRAESWPDSAEIFVRMGVHMGPARFRSGLYFGATVNTAGRVMSAAHGGQVVVTSAVVESAESLPVAALGSHRLKDLSEPVDLFEVEGLGQFPPLQSLDPHRHNLPIRNAMIGRDEELSAVVDLALENSLVTIVGVGGMGKTRLALAAAAQAFDTICEEVWLCELADIGEPGSVADLVAGVLGVSRGIDRSAVEAIGEYCRRRSLLLVLDNCEHVLDEAADIIEEILRVAPRARVLATSREALGVQSEMIFPLRPLKHADDGSPARELFVERALAADSTQTWSDADNVSIDAICHRLDGIPLAIELAAARTKLQAPSELAQHLDEALLTMHGGRRSLERHRTLWAAIDWSYRALGESERRMFERLSVLAGGASLEAVQAVGATEATAESAFAAADALVGCSLLSAERTPTGTRYRLLEPVRQYAESALASRGDQVDAHDAHLLHFSEMAEQWNASVWAPGLDVVDRLEADVANYRAAVEWVLVGDLERRRIDAVLSMVDNLSIAQLACGQPEIGRWSARLFALDEVRVHELGPSIGLNAELSLWTEGDANQSNEVRESILDLAAYSPDSVRGNRNLFVLSPDGPTSEQWDSFEPQGPEEQYLMYAHTTLHFNPKSTQFVAAAAKLGAIAQQTDSEMLKTAAELYEGIANIADPALALQRFRSAAAREAAAGLVVAAGISGLYLGLAAGLCGETSATDLVLLQAQVRRLRDNGERNGLWVPLVGAAAALAPIDHGRAGALVRGELAHSDMADSTLAYVLPLLPSVATQSPERLGYEATIDVVESALDESIGNLLAADLLTEY